MANVNDRSSEEARQTGILYNRDRHIARLQQTIIRNTHGCDLLFNLFFTALHSYKVRRCLRPLPPGFETNDMRGINRLKNMCELVPNFKTGLLNINDLPSEVIALLSWLLVQRNEPYLKLVNEDFRFPRDVNISTKPTFIFEVIYSKRSRDQWNERKQNQRIISALHGSNLENFYSIVRFGLQQHFGREELQVYGSGIYLSTEYNVSVIFSPFSRCWNRSILGSKLSVLALCEVLDIKGKVRRKDSKNQALTSDNSLPDKYIVVTDNDAVRVTHLLVYSSKNNNAIKSWVFQHMGIILLLTYFLFLCLIGSWQNVKYFCIRLWNRYLKHYYPFQ